DSDVAETSEPPEDTGPRPCRYEPRRVQRDYGQQQQQSQQTEVQMSCITEHRGFQSTCLDVWVLETAYYAYRQQHGTDSHRGHEYVY
ncbi:unnamed protein product, partial [Porites lobata]